VRRGTASGAGRGVGCGRGGGCLPAVGCAAGRYGGERVAQRHRLRDAGAAGRCARLAGVARAALPRGDPGGRLALNAGVLAGLAGLAGDTRRSARDTRGRASGTPCAAPTGPARTGGADGARSAARPPGARRGGAAGGLARRAAAGDDGAAADGARSAARRGCWPGGGPPPLPPGGRRAQRARAFGTLDVWHRPTYRGHACAGVAGQPGEPGQHARVERQPATRVAPRERSAATPARACNTGQQPRHLGGDGAGNAFTTDSGQRRTNGR